MAWNENDIVVGLAEAMWKEAGGEAADGGTRIGWADEYFWVREKWVRYARAALAYLSSVPRPDAPETGTAPKLRVIQAPQ